MRFTILPVFLLLVFSPTIASAQSLASRHVLTQSEIALALHTAGVAINPLRIVLQASVTSTVESPSLSISASGLSSPSVLRLRITCQKASECLPFFAFANFDDDAEASAAQRLLRSDTPGKERNLAQGHRGVSAGQHAYLLIENEHMRIQLPVISIDTGCVGTQVRVTSLDRKLTYQATVTGEETVRGTLR